MAHHTQHFANHFAHSTDLADDMDYLEYAASYVSEPESQAPLRVHVERVVREYFVAMGDEIPTDVYALILKEVELPLLTVALEQTRGNQTKCAKILGLNRGTLRKKLKLYGLMD